VFAFFGGIIDNPDTITAVCLEEDPATGSLRVLLSINKARPIDGHRTMIEVERGFESIWKALSCISSGCQYYVILTLHMLANRDGLQV
jgi:hypothetical protein